jgi:ferrous iron transport protein B
MQWYFLEVAPLFLIASVVIWLGQMRAGWVALPVWITYVATKRLTLWPRLLVVAGSAALGFGAMNVAGGVNLFEVAISALKPLTSLLTLPSQAAEVFLFGFFRRDYGAAGLDKMMATNPLSPAQVLVIAVTITLFLPCVAQFLIVRRERGLKMALGMLAFTLGFATLVGSGLAQVLRMTGWLS